MSVKGRQILSLAVAGVVMVAGCSRSSHDSQPAKSVSTPAPSHAHTNRLAREKSPYLLQHQHNPVDWYPWGSEAFEKARKENKPIFLSIGYSTCHWCHVMERESFENEELAKFLNGHFISIKVDREERPDVDKIYMTAVQAMTGQGGWPLNCFLTPDRKPFYGGTYFPPEAKYGRPSFLQLLQHIAQLWETKNTELLSDATKFQEQLENFGVQPSPAGTALSPGVITNALARFKEEYEPRFGGFGNAPKFPRPSLPAFVLRQGVRFEDQEAVKMVLHTCDRMAAGGMYDQLGGGFSRYSVDAQWLVPHFEKMLYDNAQLVHLYLDAYLVSGEKRHADVARDILRYILRDMTHPGGGFYSAEDADSEGHEGKFYCWTRAELSKLLTVEEFNVTVKYFGITKEGNFEDHSHPTPLKNQNVLSIVNPELPVGDQPLLAAARKKMFDVRVKRIRPHLDDKILASWNGMMLGAIARAYAVLGDNTYRTAAEKNLAFLQAKLWDAKSKTLYNRWRDGERDSVQLLEAYANLIAGTIDLYEATLDPKHLEFALALTETMVAKFYDPVEGGFFQSPTGSTDLIIRVKEDYDGAEPSGNSIASLALLKLSAITDRKNLRDIADRSLQHFAVRMMQAPQAVPQMLLALDFAMDEPKRAVIVGNLADTRTRELLRTIHSTYQPNKVVLGQDGPVESFAKEMRLEKSPMLYLCTGKACQPPTNDPAKIRKYLEK